MKKLNIDFDELKAYARTAAPHIKNDIELDRWLSASANVMNFMYMEKEPEMTPEKRKSSIISKLQYELNKMSKFTNWDMAILYTSHNGGYVSFGSDPQNARTVISEKLAQSTTTAWRSQTFKSQLLGDYARNGFISSMGGYDLQAIPKVSQALESKDAWEDHPWVDAKCGGIFKDKFGKVWMVDYAFPGNSEKATKLLANPPESNLVKSAITKAYIEGNIGITIDHIALVVVDYEDSLKISVRELSVTNDLVREVVEIGDYYYENFLLEERLPTISFGNADFQTITEMKPVLQNAVTKYVIAKKMEGIAVKTARIEKSKVEEAMRLSGIVFESETNKTKTALGPLTFSCESKSVLDNNLLIIKIRELGGEPNLIVEKSVDDRLKEQFLALGGNIHDSSIYKETFSKRVNITRSKNHHSFDFVNDIESTARDMFDETNTVISSNHSIPEVELRGEDPTLPHVLEEREMENQAKMGEDNLVF